MVKNIKGLLLRILGFAPNCFGKSRHIRDLQIKCVCPSEEILPNQVRPYEKDDLVCVVVLEVKKENQRYIIFFSGPENFKKFRPKNSSNEMS